MTRRSGAVLLAILGLAVGPAPAAPEVGTFQDVLARLDVEVGVESGTLIVMPILLRQGAAPTTLGQRPAPEVRWEAAPVPGNPELVRIAGGGLDAVGLPTFVPAGTLLPGGARERVLTRPVAALPGAPWLVQATACDSRTEPAPAATQGPIGPLAPIEQRKFDLLRADGESFGMLQRIQALTAGLDGNAKTVGDVLASKFVTEGVALRMKELKRIPPAYGGRTVGHVAFFGFRPVEAVLFADPISYRVHGPAYLEAVAASHTLWEEAMGVGGRGDPRTDLRDLKPSCRAVLAAFAEAHPRKWILRRGETAVWRDSTADTRKRKRSERHDRSFPFLVRLLEDDSGRFLFAEALEYGEDLIFPPPLREPRGVDEDERRRGGGGLGVEALRRILDRLERNRAR